ncbi:MAG: hypothetical protein FWD83_02450 [Promicromonosporaceae bacterium]|nr:hypothetical protein [Promicromonosporaceae bacterium]
MTKLHRNDDPHRDPLLTETFADLARAGASAADPDGMFTLVHKRVRHRRTGKRLGVGVAGFVTAGAVVLAATTFVPGGGGITVAGPETGEAAGVVSLEDLATRADAIVVGTVVDVTYLYGSESAGSPITDDEDGGVFFLPSGEGLGTWGINNVDSANDFVCVVSYNLVTDQAMVTAAWLRGTPERSAELQAQLDAICHQMTLQESEPIWVSGAARGEDLISINPADVAIMRPGDLGDDMSVLAFALSVGHDPSCLAYRYIADGHLECRDFLVGVPDTATPPEDALGTTASPEIDNGYTGPRGWMCNANWTAALDVAEIWARPLPGGAWSLSWEQEDAIAAHCATLIPTATFVRSAGYEERGFTLWIGPDVTDLSVFAEVPDPVWLDATAFDNSSGLYADFIGQSFPDVDFPALSAGPEIAVDVPNVFPEGRRDSYSGVTLPIPSGPIETTPEHDDEIDPPAGATRTCMSFGMTNDGKEPCENIFILPGEGPTVGFFSDCPMIVGDEAGFNQCHADGGVLSFIESSSNPQGDVVTKFGCRRVEKHYSECDIFTFNETRTTRLVTLQVSAPLFGDYWSDGPNLNHRIVITQTVGSAGEPALELDRPYLLFLEKNPEFLVEDHVRAVIEGDTYTIVGGSAGAFIDGGCDWCGVSLLCTPYDTPICDCDGIYFSDDCGQFPSLSPASSPVPYLTVQDVRDLRDARDDATALADVAAAIMARHAANYGETNLAGGYTPSEDPNPGGDDNHGQISPGRANNWPGYMPNWPEDQPIPNGNLAVAWGLDPGVFYVTWWGSSSCPMIATDAWADESMHIQMTRATDIPVVEVANLDCTDDIAPHTTILRTPDGVTEAAAVPVAVFVVDSPLCGTTFWGELTPETSVTLMGEGTVAATLPTWYGSTCATPLPFDAAVWTLAPGTVLTPDTTSFEVLATRLGCSGGYTGEIVYTSTVRWGNELVVTLGVEPLGDGTFTCPGNEEVLHTIELGAPLGDLRLVDGQCVPTIGEATGTVFCNPATRWDGTTIIHPAW